MKKFIIKILIIFLFLLLLFRFTFISFFNNLENKLESNFSKSTIREYKNKMFNEMENLNKKDRIFYEEDAKTLSIFIKKILKELDLK